jgi:hypothetical protein
MKLTKNLNTSGRLLRLAIAILFLAYAYWNGSWIALAASLFTAFEALFSWCVLYQLLGKNSCPIHKNKK